MTDEAVRTLAVVAQGACSTLPRVRIGARLHPNIPGVGVLVYAVGQRDLDVSFSLLQASLFDPDPFAFGAEIATRAHLALESST